MTEQWKVGDVAVLGKPNADVVELKGQLCVLQSHHCGTDHDSNMWVAMFPSTGKTTSVFETELERP